MAQRIGSGEAARRLRVFLDRLAMYACDDAPYLLDPKYRDLVMGGEGKVGDRGAQDGPVVRLLRALRALGDAAEAVDEADGDATSAAKVAAKRSRQLLAVIGRARGRSD